MTDFPVYSPDLAGADRARFEAAFPVYSPALGTEDRLRFDAAAAEFLAEQTAESIERDNRRAQRFVNRVWLAATRAGRDQAEAVVAGTLVYLFGTSADAAEYATDLEQHAAEAAAAGAGRREKLAAPFLRLAHQLAAVVAIAERLALRVIRAAGAGRRRHRATRLLAGPTRGPDAGPAHDCRNTSRALARTCAAVRGGVPAMT